MANFNELEKNLSEVVKKHIVSFPPENKTPEGLTSRLMHYEKNKVDIVKDFNSYIDVFIQSNTLSIKEKQILNALTKKYENKLIYGFEYPSNM